MENQHRAVKFPHHLLFTTASSSDSLTSLAPARAWTCVKLSWKCGRQMTAGWRFRYKVPANAPCSMGDTNGWRSRQMHF